jgi:uncharacterized membrane protein
MEKRFTSRKFLIGLASFIALLALSILGANKVLVVPDTVLAMLTGITVTWLTVEGLVDYKRQPKGKQI